MSRTLAAIAVTAALLIGAGTPVLAQPGYEPEPVLQASELVAPELLSGPNFTVDKRVPIKGFIARFTIRSTFGVFEAHGLQMLQIRVREVYALAQLDSMSKTSEFAEAAAKAAARPLTSAANMVMNPVQTVEGLPDGVTRLFDRIKLGGEAVAAAATQSGASTGQKVTDVGERVGSITITALGFEKERRDLAKSLGVDPYTTNPVLSKKLTDMAWVAFSGRFGIQAAMSVFVPYSMAMSAVTITNSTVYDTPAGDLINNARSIFAATGASDPMVDALMKNTQYSLSVLTALAMGIQRLKGVNGLPSIVDFAAIAQTQDETNFIASSINILARYHETVAPIASVGAPGPIIARTATGTPVIPAAVDYVAWTERAGRFAARKDLEAPQRVAWISGQLSRRAQKEFESRHWTIYETFSISAER